MQSGFWKATAGIAVLAVNISGLPALRSAAERAHCFVSREMSRRNSSTRKTAGVQENEERVVAAFDGSLIGITPAVWTPQHDEASAEAQQEVADLNMQLRDALSQAQVFEDGEQTGWLGIEPGEVTQERLKDLKLSAERGVYVERVQSGSPAEKAGLKAGDVILSYDQQDIEGTVQFRRLIEETPPGRTIRLEVWRDGKMQDVSARIEERSEVMDAHMFKMKPETMTPGDFPRSPLPPNFMYHYHFPKDLDFGTPRLGVSAQDLNEQLGSYFGAPKGQGVLVVEVIPGSAAEKAGLKAGDVITQVEGKPVKSTDNLRGQLSAKPDAAEVTLEILRRGAGMTIHVKLPPSEPSEDLEMIQRVAL
jgi:serine protease Do